MESECVSDMIGNQIVKIDRIPRVIKENMCCKKCAMVGHTKYIAQFLKFSHQHERDVELEEQGIHGWTQEREDILWRLLHETQ